MKMTTGKWVGVALLSGAMGLTVPIAFSRDDDGGWRREQCGHGEHGDRSTRYQKHQAELHEKLKLTPEQEAAWSEFTKAFTPPQKPEANKPKNEALTAPQRMEAMLTRMQMHQERFAGRLAAVKDFYARLTPEQQKVFDEEFGPRGRGHRRDRG